MTRSLSIAVAVALALVPARALAQDRPLDEAPAVSLEQLTPRVQLQPRAEAPPAGRTSLLNSLYVSTAVMQGLDVHSTLTAINHGGVEGNAITAPMTAHPGAFIAAKSAVAATTIFAAHQISKRNKTAAIITLLAANSAYAVVIAHNYHLAGSR